MASSFYWELSAEMEANESTELPGTLSVGAQFVKSSQQTVKLLCCSLACAHSPQHSRPSGMTISTSPSAGQVLPCQYWTQPLQAMGSLPSTQHLKQRRCCLSWDILAWSITMIPFSYLWEDVDHKYQPNSFIRKKFILPIQIERDYHCVMYSLNSIYFTLQHSCSLNDCLRERSPQTYWWSGKSWRASGAL